MPHNQHEHAPFGHLPDEGLVTLHIDCAAEDAGWIVTYDGAYPHTGSISGARPGAKVIMQVGDRADLDTKIEEYDFSILLLCSGQVFGF